MQLPIELVDKIMRKTDDNTFYRMRLACRLFNELPIYEDERDRFRVLHKQKFTETKDIMDTLLEINKGIQSEFDINDIVWKNPVFFIWIRDFAYY